MHDQFGIPLGSFLQPTGVFNAISMLIGKIFSEKKILRPFRKWRKQVPLQSLTFPSSQDSITLCANDILIQLKGH